LRAVYELPSIALVGAPGAGRGRLLRALAPDTRHRTNLSARLAADHGRIALADPLLAGLAQLLGSAKSTPAQFEIVDCQAGLAAAHGQAEWFGNLAAFDALAMVLGLFAEPEPAAKLDEALAGLRDELNLWDLGLAERRLERIGAELARAPRAERVQLERERDLFDRIADHLNNGRSLADFDLPAADADLLRGFGFLGGIPFLVIANTADSAVGDWDRLKAGCRWPLVGVCAELESEAGELEPALGSELLAEFGITGGPVSQRFLAGVADALAIRTCYTANRREARAWAVGPRASALELADAVHSDVARGFIRAEVIAADELVELGSLARARELGRLRREGRDYQLADRELVTILFSG
jgi:hypothetical protein